MKETPSPLLQTLLKSDLFIFILTLQKLKGKSIYSREQQKEVNVIQHVYQTLHLNFSK